MKRKQWTEESMLTAMKAVEDGEKVATAARTFNVPRITLHPSDILSLFSIFSFLPLLLVCRHHVLSF